MSICFGYKVRLVLLGTFVFGATVQANPPQMLPSFKVAAVAYDPAWGDLEGNIERMAQ